MTLAGITPILIASVIFGRYIRKISKEKQAKRAELGIIAEENISNIRTVKAFANEQRESEKFRIKNEEAYKLGIKSAAAQSFMVFFV